MNNENEIDGVEDAEFEPIAEPVESSETSTNWPAPGADAYVGMPTSEERTWAAVAHFSGVFSSLVVPVVVCVVIFIMKKDESKFIEVQAREALNFQITTAVAAFVSGLLVFLCGIGIPLLIIVSLGAFILAIVGAIKAYGGESYRYPLNWRVFD
ncbi:MAG: putative Tic20 family protein [Planctomycetota bacterium]|jgi:uncharacterized Tic20 family protein